MTTLTELQEAEQKLAKRIKKQQHMKDVNKICGKAGKNQESLLSAMGLTATEIYNLLNPKYSYEKKGYQGWELTNNGAEIRRLTKRVEELKAKEYRQDTMDDEEISFEGGTCTLAHGEDRLRLDFDKIPDDATIKKLKDNGFHWSPRLRVWQRQLTSAAKYSATYCVGVSFDQAA